MSSFYKLFLNFVHTEFWKWILEVITTKFGVAKLVAVSEDVKQ